GHDDDGVKRGQTPHKFLQHVDAANIQCPRPHAVEICVGSDPYDALTYLLIMSTILSRVSGMRIHAFAPELGNISSSGFSGRSEMRMIGMSFLFDCDFSTSLRRLPLMLGRLTSRKMMSGELPAST